MDRRLIVIFIFYLCIFSRICISLNINNTDAYEPIEDQAIVNSSVLLSTDISQTIDDENQPSPAELEDMTHIRTESSIATLDSTDTVTKILRKSRHKKRKSLKERSRRQEIQSGYAPGYDSHAISRLFDMCPVLGFTCPTCAETELRLPPNFCSLIAMKVILISPPMTDDTGRVCGKFGLLTIHGNADIKDFRRLLRFSLQESCGCHLKASRQYYLISPVSTFFKEDMLFNKIILTDQVMLISADRFIDRDIFQAFKECSTTGSQSYTTVSYFSQSIDPKIAYPYPAPSNQPQSTYSYQIPPIQPRTADPIPVQPIQSTVHPIKNPNSPIPVMHPASSIYSDKLSYSSPPLNPAPTLSEPSSAHHDSASYYGNLSPPLEQSVSSDLKSITGPHNEGNAFPFTGCTVSSSCPECYRIETIPDITQHYCASNYAFVAVLSFPDLPTVSNLNYTSTCLNVATNIIYEVSKHIDPRVVVNSLSTFIPIMCSGCFLNLKKPAIALLISDVYPIPPATQLDGNFRLFFIPVPSTITLPNCDIYYPSLYSFRLDNVQQYTSSSDCPVKFEQTCSLCRHYSDAILATACESGFAVVAEIEFSGSLFISQRIPPIAVRTTRAYYSKSVEITFTNPPSYKCVQGYLNIIENIRHPYLQLYQRIPFVSLPNCECLPKVSRKVLIFSPEPLVLSPAEALPLTNNINIVFLPTNEPIPNCSQRPDIASYIPSELTYIPPTPPSPIYRNDYLPPPLYITPPSYIFSQMSYSPPPPPYKPALTPGIFPPPLSPNAVYIPFTSSPKITYGDNKPEISSPNSSKSTTGEHLVDNSRDDSSIVNESLAPVNESLLIVDEPLPSVDEPSPSEGETLLIVNEPSPSVDEPSPSEGETLLIVNEPLDTVNVITEEVPLSPVDETLSQVDETSLSVDENLSPVFIDKDSSHTANTNLHQEVTVIDEHLEVGGLKSFDEIAITTSPITIHASNEMEGSIDMSSFDISDAKPATPDEKISFVPCLSEEVVTCPQTIDEIQKEFSDLYCYSKFAFLVAVGFDAKFISKDVKGQELRILASPNLEDPFIGIDYGGKKLSRNVTVTVTPAKTMERRAKQPSDDSLCYHEKVLALYDLSPESLPKEMLQDLDIYIPSSCDSSLFDISPVYGILISEEQPNLNNVIQLTDKFVFYALPEGKLTLPPCNIRYEPPITTKYEVQMEENLLPFVTCHASGCAEWVSVKDEEFIIPCNVKFAALVRIEETSAGKNIAPSLEILESLSDRNTPLYTLNVFENTEGDNIFEDAIKPVQVEYVDGSVKCKYATLKIIKNLFPESGIKQNELFTLVAGIDCDNPVFKMVKGVALLMSDRFIESDYVVPLDGETLMVGILPGTTTISVCPQSTSIYFNLVPENLSPDLSPHENVISPNTEYPETLIIDASESIIYNDPLPDQNIVDEYPTKPPYLATTITYEEPPQPAVVVNLSKDDTAPIMIQKSSLTGEGTISIDGSCDEHMSQTCPVCGEIGSLSPNVYCNAKLSLFARSTGYHYRNYNCSFGALGTLYEITASKIPILALLRILYSIPPHCSCPALERDGYLLLILEEYVPLTSPLSLQLSKGLHIYPADRGRTILPGCVYPDPIKPRSKVLKNMRELESVDKELRVIMPELSNPTCPTIDHSCPKCGSMSDEELEELICSAEEVLLVSRNKTAAKIPRKPLRTGKTTFTQTLNEGNHVLEINIDQYENMCTFPLVEGNCSESIPRYYYDAEYEMCTEFSYSGCNGNANNFLSYEQCEDNCIIEDFCIEGNLSIEKIIKSSDASDYFNSEFIYAFPDHCNCPHLLQDKIVGYLISEMVADHKDVSIQLSKNYYFVPLSESQKMKKFSCISDIDSRDFNKDLIPSDVQIKNRNSKNEKKKWGFFG